MALAGSRTVVARDPNLTKAEAFVNKKCPADERQISTGMWDQGFRFNALYGNCRAADGRDQHIWFFDRGGFLATDGPNSSHEIIGLWRDGRTMAFLYVLYRQSDPECCPTGGGAIVRFRWYGAPRVIHLDALPPRESSTGGRVGR
jgi:hypothetical protein